MFSFVMLERGLEWYRRLLMPSLPDNQQLNINPKNCIGTVLSINGYRKYFCEWLRQKSQSGRSFLVSARYDEVTDGWVCLVFPKTNSTACMMHLPYIVINHNLGFSTVC